MDGKEMQLSLDSLAKLGTENLCSIGAKDGTVHTLFSSDSTKNRNRIKDCTFGLRSKFPAFDEGESSEKSEI